jgi:hypothetical protein
MKPDGQLSTSPTATSDLKLPWVGRRVSLTARDSGYNVQEAFYNELQVLSTTIVRQALAAPCCAVVCDSFVEPDPWSSHPHDNDDKASEEDGCAYANR